jgi:hypothetical protein
MQELIRLIIGIAVLLLGIPLGDFLARVTNDEQEKGQWWFRFIILLALIGGFVGLIIGNDIILFSFFFIAIITSRSLR